MDLNTQWFMLLGILLSGYAILDGFDLGVGILHFVARGDRERRVMMNSIGPLWDGNEVWLVTFGGALFAAFPECYATVFSAFYTAFMLLLFGLIFRAVSMEFRSKRDTPMWRGFWDGAFSVSSTVVALLFGVAVGNAMLGLPIDTDREFQGTLLDMLGFYPLLVGVLVVALFAMHGSVYLLLKTEGALHERVGTWFWRCFMAFLVIYVVTTAYTLVNVPNALRNFREMPWIWVVVAVNVLLIANIPRCVKRARFMAAFLSSAGAIVALNALFGFALFPDMVVSSLNPDWSLTIYNAASSQKTLWIMRLIAILGIPFVLSYTSAIYWVFRGKVEIGTHSY
jgi:cytochrome bd ubiquinol oxidase subunit II